MCEATPVVSVAYARRFSSNGRACSAGGATSGSEPRMVVREPVTSRCTVWRRSCLPPVVIDIASPSTSASHSACVPSNRLDDSASRWMNGRINRVGLRRTMPAPIEVTQCNCRLRCCHGKFMAARNTWREMVWQERPCLSAGAGGDREKAPWQVQIELLGIQDGKASWKSGTVSRLRNVSFRSKTYKCRRVGKPGFNPRLCPIFNRLPGIDQAVAHYDPEMIDLLTGAAREREHRLDRIVKASETALFPVGGLWSEGEIHTTGWHGPRSAAEAAQDRTLLSSILDSRAD